jgi:hypothetical protein
VSQYDDDDADGDEADGRGKGQRLHVLLRETPHSRAESPHTHTHTHTHTLYFMNVRCSGEWTSLVFTNSSTIHTLRKYGSAIQEDLL